MISPNRRHAYDSFAHAWLVRDSALSPAPRLGLPLSLMDHAPAADESLVLTRSFNRPTGLDGRVVHLCLATTGCDGYVSLNGDRLGTIDNADSRIFDVTDRLTEHNRLEITVRVSADNAAIHRVELQIDNAEKQKK